MSRKAPTTDGWSFSLRSYGCDGQDSSSDSDADDDDDHQQAAVACKTGKSSLVSEEASLLEELDISSRVDTATYKPNPWSIAKANASTRPKLVTPSMHPTVSSGATTTRKDKPPHPTVLDLLRKPCKRASASNSYAKPVPPKRQAHGRNSIPIDPPTPGHVDAHTPSDETLVDDGFDNQHCLSKSSENCSEVATLVAFGPLSPPAMSSHEGKLGPGSRSIPRNISLPRDISPLKPSSSTVSTYPLPNTAHIVNHSGSSLVHPQPAAQFLTKATPKKDLRSMLFRPSTRAHHTPAMSASPHGSPLGSHQESNKFFPPTSISGVSIVVNVLREQYFCLYRWSKDSFPLCRFIIQTLGRHPQASGFQT